MAHLYLMTWSIREGLALFTLTFLLIFPIIAMWRLFVKGSDEKTAK